MPNFEHFEPRSGHCGLSSSSVRQKYLGIKFSPSTCELYQSIQFDKLAAHRVLIQSNLRILYSQKIVSKPVTEHFHKGTDEESVIWREQTGMAQITIDRCTPTRTGWVPLKYLQRAQSLADPGLRWSRSFPNLLMLLSPDQSKASPFSRRLYIAYYIAFGRSFRAPPSRLCQHRHQTDHPGHHKLQRSCSLSR